MCKVVGPALGALCLLFACTKPPSPHATGRQTEPSKTIHAHATPAAASLRRALEAYFLVGTALSEAQIMATPPHALAFAASQFNAVTAENSMKWQHIQPTPGQYTWQAADRLVAFAAEHRLHVTGHVLVWHQQTPAWVFAGDQGKPASGELLAARLKQHIRTYMGRYRGRVAAWDVVNEALNEDGSLRESLWWQILGEEYLAIAFATAHEVDPTAKLIYNDYNLFQPSKRAGAVALVKKLQAANVPIHGIGMQGHYSLGYPHDLKLVEDAIVAFAELGVEVHVTELDLSVLPFPNAENQGADISLNLALSAEFNPFTDGLSNTAEAQFNQTYLDLFKLFIRHHDKIARVTLWGVNDAQSWRNDWPMKGRTDYPLLIDRNNQLKPAALQIIDYAQTLKR